MRHWYNLCFLDLKLGRLLTSVTEFVSEIATAVMQGMELEL